MRIFVCLCALFVSFQTAYSDVETEQHYFNYVAKNYAVNKLAIGVTQYLGSVNDEIYELALNFHNNISTLRQNYGTPKFVYIKKKLIAAKDQESSRVCINYVEELLEVNEKYQKDIFHLIETILIYFKTAYVSLYEHFLATRGLLTDVEKEAFDCGDLLERKDYMEPWVCAEKALGKTTTLHDQTTRRFPQLLQNLKERKVAALDSLHQELETRKIVYFYDEEDELDRRLRRYCAQ